MALRGALFAGFTASVQSALFLPKIFSDGLVLQQQSTYDQRPQIFGYGQAGEVVTINRTLSSGGGFQSYQVVADESGYFIAELNCDNSNADYVLTIGGSTDPSAVISIHNVTYGDVLLCSGQSNMVFSVKSDFQGPDIMSKSYPNIRLFAIAQSAALTPQRDIPDFTGGDTPCWWPQNPKTPNSTQLCNTWQVAQPTITDDFSATCFFTAVHLSEQFPGRTFGLIYGAVDGTPMQAWSPPEANAKCAGIKEGDEATDTASAAAVAEHRAGPIASSDGSGPINPNNATVLWNAMIAPLVRFAIRGVVWYQGESDSGSSFDLFTCKFSALIAAWRTHWRIGDFAWTFVQLAPQDSAQWPQSYILTARLAQAATLPQPGGNTTCTTGMATAIDLGDMGSPFPPSHVHPRHKFEVGRRLAAAFLHAQYAWQWPQGGANMTGRSFDWRGPLGVDVRPNPSSTSSLRGSGPAAAAAPSSYLVRFDTLSGAGVYLNSTSNCWECCAAAQDVIQLCASADGATCFNWVNTTVAVSLTDNSTLVATPLTPGAYNQARYAASLWPQCVVYSASNAIASPPFLLNITGVSESPVLAAKVATMQVHEHASSSRAVYTGPKLGWALPLAQRGPNTWTEWRGRVVPPVAAANGTAPTPPMGFNSWNAYHCNVDESIALQVADAFHALGLAAVGYEYVNLDDCWQVDRTSSGLIVPDPVRFPSGIASVADRIHALGLKFGVYTAANQYTCQMRPGSFQHELLDAVTYCSWGIDYLKTDGCFGNHWPAINTSWINFRQGIDACTQGGGRPIVLSVESCGTSNPDDCQAWIPGLANLWRTTGDIQATWVSVMSNLDGNNPLAHIAGPGHWNDADMLQIGNPGLSEDEQRSHFAAWAIIASPLLIGTDLTNIDSATLAILAAPEVIAVSQDPLGVQGERVSAAAPDGQECWARPLADGSVAVLLLNRGSSAASVTCTFAQAGLKNPNGAADVRDLWAQTDLGSFTGAYTAKSLPPHASALVKLSQQ